MAAEHARAVFSSGVCEKAAWGRCFRVPSNTKKPARAAIAGLEASATSYAEHLPTCLAHLLTESSGLRPLPLTFLAI